MSASEWFQPHARPALPPQRRVALRDVSDVRPAAPTTDACYQRAVDRVLTFARQHLRMDVAWMSRVTSTDQVLERVTADDHDRAPAPGTTAPLSESYCLRVLDGRLPAAIPDTGADLVARELPPTADLEIGAYLGVPVHRPDGGVYGMLCCISHAPRPDLGGRDLATMTLLAEMLSDLLDRSPLPDGTDGVRARVTAAVAGTGVRTVLQPLVDVVTGEVVGLEALTRFPSGVRPTSGSATPGRWVCGFRSSWPACAAPSGRWTGPSSRWRSR